MAFVHYLYTDLGRTSPNIDQTLSQARHYYKIHGRSSNELLSAAVLGNPHRECNVERGSFPGTQTTVHG